MGFYCILPEYGIERVVNAKNFAIYIPLMVFLSQVAIGTLEKGVKHVQIQQIHENKGVSDVVINCTFIVYFEHDSRLFLVFQLLTLNRYLFQMFAGWFIIYNSFFC